MRWQPILATLYRPLTLPLERWFLGPLRSRLLGGLTGSVLDLGTGVGWSLPHLRRAETVTAVDVEPAMLREARREARRAGPLVHLVHADAARLPFRAGSFDAVVTGLVLCSVADLTQALAEVRRVLRPDGDLVYLEHVRLEGFWGRVQEAVNPAWRLAAGCRLDRRTVEAIEEAGLAVGPVQRRAGGLLVAGRAARHNGVDA